MIIDDSESELDASDVQTDDDFIVLAQTKKSLRGINAHRAAVSARNVSGGWQIEAQEEHARSGTPISLHARGRFRPRRYRGRGARAELISSHRRFVEELVEEEIVNEPDAIRSTIRPTQQLPPLSQGIVLNEIHV